MNYRHAFHAGNFADVAKHLALVSIIVHLKKKKSPFAVIDTHAGSGLYALLGEASKRTGEASAGIGSLDSMSTAAGILGDYLGIVRSFGEGLYPGSPLIAAQLLRPADRLIAIEKLPEDAKDLKQNLRGAPNARAEEADGYVRLLALLPPSQRRGLILMDPAFEAPDEFERLARTFLTAYRRFAHGVYLLWFPLKSTNAADALGAEICLSGAKDVVRIDIAVPPTSIDAKQRLATAGLIIVNPPFGFDTQMHAALAVVAPLLSPQARFDVRWLARGN